MADIVLRPAFPNAEVERQRADRIGELIQQRDDPESVAAVAAAGALYGSGHPKGYGQLGTEPAIRAVTRDDLVDFWRRHYVPGNAALVVSGDIARGELKALVESRFAAWARADVPDGDAGEPAGTPARLVLVDQPGAVQTALRITSIGVARTTPDFPALQVLNAALGGMFSSRLNDKLRETKGYTYGISSWFRYDRTPGPFVIASSVRRDATGASVREIFSEVNAMRDAPLPAAELDTARDAQVLSLPGAFETNADIGASMADIFIYGLPLDYYARLPGQLSAVTAAQVQAAARKYLGPDKMKVIAVGDRKRILPQLQTLGLGTVEVRDSDGQLPRPRQ